MAIPAPLNIEENAELDESLAGDGEAQNGFENVNYNFPPAGPILRFQE